MIACLAAACSPLPSVVRSSMSPLLQTLTCSRSCLQILCLALGRAAWFCLPSDCLNSIQTSVWGGRSQGACCSSLDMKAVPFPRRVMPYLARMACSGRTTLMPGQDLARSAWPQGPLARCGEGSRASFSENLGKLPGKPARCQAQCTVGSRSGAHLGRHEAPIPVQPRDSFIDINSRLISSSRTNGHHPSSPASPLLTQPRGSPI